MKKDKKEMAVLFRKRPNGGIISLMKKLPTETNYSTIQMKIPLDLEKIVDISDSVYSFNKVMEHT